jgi:hypothetical protein
MRELDDDEDEERLSHLLALVRRCLPIASGDDYNRPTVFLVYPSDAALVLLLSLGELSYLQKNDTSSSYHKRSNKAREQR